MKFDHAKVNGVCLFTTNSKTACPSWAISSRSCVGAKGCEVCKKCYGKKGRFVYSNVQNALNQRYDWFNQTPESDVVNTVVTEALHYNLPYFRVHVVGDFENKRSIRIWTKIVETLPHIRFWFPTKAYRVRGLLHALRKLNALENAVVRPSASDFDIEAPEVEGLAAGATAYKNSGLQKEHLGCPGDCENCRICWDKPKIRVSYHYH